jgi:hypothetical protein
MASISKLESTRVPTATSAVVLTVALVLLTFFLLQ